MEWDRQQETDDEQAFASQFDPETPWVDEQPDLWPRCAGVHFVCVHVCLTGVILYAASIRASHHNHCLFRHIACTVTL